MIHKLAAFIVTFAGIKQACSVSEAELVCWDVADGGNGHCYEVLTGPLLSNGVPGVVTWAEASLDAETRGGYLATIGSAAENEFVFNLTDSPEFWTTDTLGNYFGPWLGGQQSAEAQDAASDWFWVTGEPFGYTNWHPGEPNDLFGHLEEDRLMLFAIRGYTGIRSSFWNDEWGMRRVTIAYVVEYVPEPSTAMLLFATLFCTSRHFPRHAFLTFFRPQQTPTRATEAQTPNT
jgi:hypothetical protein